MDKCPCPECNSEDTFARLTRERDEARAALVEAHVEIEQVRHERQRCRDEVVRLRALLRKSMSRLTTEHDDLKAEINAALEGRDG